MEFFYKKTKFFYKLLAIAATLLLISTILFPRSSYADMINDPEIDYLDISSPIVLEFDKSIQWSPTIPYYSTYLPASPIGISSTHTGIKLEDISTTPSSPVSFDIKIVGKKLFITPGTGSKWVEDTKYKITITEPIVVESIAPYNDVLPSDISITKPLVLEFGTDFLTFEELMSGSRKINTIIQNYTPRYINVTAPKRYVNEIEIIHKRQDLVQNKTTESVTNVDVTINPTIEVNRIEVTPKMNGANIQAKKTVTVNTSTRLYDFGFTRLPDTSAFDFEVILYDIDDNVLDKRIVKVPYEPNNLTTIKQKDRYRSAGKTFTLYNLLDKPSDLQTLLDENRMDEIKVQVVQY